MSDRSGYISTACRVGNHDDCAEHPVVACACPCHPNVRILKAGTPAPLRDG